MPEELDSLLARLRQVLDEDDFREVASAVGVDPDAVDGAGGGGSGSDVPPAATEASAGEMKADGEGAPDEAVTEDELEARLEEIREEAVSQADLAEVVDELEASAQKALAEALPGVVEGVGQKMAGGVDYADEIGDAFGTGGRTATGLEAGRTPTGVGSGRRSGTRQKAGDGAGADGVDYTDEIEAAFGVGGD